MAFYLSPLVAVNEIDQTVSTAQGISTSTAAIILRNTYKGPERKKTFISNTNDLITMFGYPTTSSDCYQDILAATGYLKYGNSLYCTRTMPTSATFAGTIGTSGTSATFYSFDDETSYKLVDFASEDPDQFAEEVIVGGILPFQMIASSRGAWGNNIRVAVIDKTTYDDIQAGTSYDWDTLYGTTADNCSCYQSIRDIDTSLDSTQEFLIVVSVKAQGSTTWSVIEYWNVSTNENKISENGNVIFAETYINETSNYIRIALNETLKNTDITISTPQWQVFGGGLDDSSGSDGITDALIEKDLDLYSNPEEIDINFFIDSNKSTTVKQYMVDLCEIRKDCLVILDCLSTDVINNKLYESSDLRTYVRDTLNVNTSYAALYGNWLEVYDKWNGKYRWIPASGHVAGIYANTDNVSEPWFAPAGLNRAILNNVRKLAWNPNQAERDIIYKNRINPIVSFAGQGKLIYGQKTLLDKESVFNRINVRRLFLTLEKAIGTSAKYFIMEQNDDISRMLFINMVDPYLRDVKSRRGIIDYLVVCDSSNNTDERIERNEFYADIYIKPTPAAEFIILNFVATKLSTSFTELAS